MKYSLVNLLMGISLLCSPIFAANAPSPLRAPSPSHFLQDSKAEDETLSRRLHVFADEAYQDKFQVSEGVHFMWSVVNDIQICWKFSAVGYTGWTAVGFSHDGFSEGAQIYVNHVGSNGSHLQNGWQPSYSKGPVDAYVQEYLVQGTDTVEDVLGRPQTLNSSTVTPSGGDLWDRFTFVDEHSSNFTVCRLAPTELGNDGYNITKNTEHALLWVATNQMDIAADYNQHDDTVRGTDSFFFEDNPECCITDHTTHQTVCSVDYCDTDAPTCAPSMDDEDTDSDHDHDHRRRLSGDVLCAGNVLSENKFTLLIAAFAGVVLNFY